MTQSAAAPIAARGPPKREAYEAMAAEHEREKGSRPPNSCSPGWKGMQAERCKDSRIVIDQAISVADAERARRQQATPAQADHCPGFMGCGRQLRNGKAMPVQAAPHRVARILLPPFG